MAISLVASTKGVALLPDFARNFLTLSVISRPLAGKAPSIDLVLGYHKANNAPLLKTFLARVDDMISHVAKNSGKSKPVSRGSPPRGAALPLGDEPQHDDVTVKVLTGVRIRSVGG
jgi:LysR family transcriptional regulator, hca operon transcriptional activator